MATTELGVPMKNCGLDVTRILPRIYQGSAPPSGTSVAQCGFHVLVLAADEYQPPASDFPGVHVIHAPFDDGLLTRRAFAVADAAADRAARAVMAGKNVLVTCYMGLNRSGLITALTVMRLKSWPPEKVVGLIQSQRPNALFNTEFVRAIRRAPI